MNVGVCCFWFVDMVGIFDLFVIFDLVVLLVVSVGIDLEFYVYNDFGMVIVNMLVVICVGVCYVLVMVGGFGEWVGNVVLEEVVVVLY